MRICTLSLALVIGLSACGGKTTTPEPPGDPAGAGDPGATEQNQEIQNLKRELNELRTER